MRRGGREKERARDQSVADTRPTVASSAPFSDPQGEGPPNGPTRNREATEASFLFDFKIPATKEEAASWCPGFAPSLQGNSQAGREAPAPQALQPGGPSAATGAPRHTQTHPEGSGGGQAISILEAKGRADRAQLEACGQLHSPLTDALAGPPAGPQSGPLQSSCHCPVPSLHWAQHKSLRQWGSQLGLLLQKGPERKTPGDSEGHF